MTTPGPTSPAQREKNALEKVLSLFSNVAAGEGGTVVLLFLNAFIMMGLYYILKPVREGLILSGFGAVVKSYSSAAQALLFIFVVPAYGAFAARVNRVWLLSGMTLFFISNLVLFILALGVGMNIGVVYFIWLGVFNFMVVSQFWAFANDVYTEEQGKRLFPVVGIGASAGALVGTVLTARVFERMSNAWLMTLASVLLVVFILLIVWVNRREIAGGGAEAEKAEQKLSKQGGFGLVMKNRYLLLIALHVLILNLVNTVGEFILGSLFEQHAIDAVGAGEAFREERGMYIRTMYGGFYAWVNLVGLLIQAFLVSRFMKYLGVRGSLFIGPIISLLTYGMTAVRPVLNVVREMKIGENANDYSLNNTVRQALFLPTTREAKYKAKAAIDTFFGRTGDALQAVVVFVGTRLAFAIPAFAVVNVVIVGIWLAVVAGIAREHKRITTET
jgi:AAA family ATP:ADP antiporter